ncbi:MAG TPA: DUF6152 family protein [Gammaproteobacteria bacterium]
MIREFLAERRRSRYALLSIAAFAAPALHAHHSGSIFDRDTVVALQGEISRFSWTNPHVYIYVVVSAADGEAVEWQIETDATPILTRSGWSADSLESGDLVVVRANPEHDTSRTHGRLVSVTTDDGAMMTARSSFATRPSETESGPVATSLEGVWSTPLATNQHLWALRDTLRELTPAAVARRDQYDITTDSPAGKCIPYPTPTFLGVPYLNEITIEDDFVRIAGELFHSERIIFTDGRGHPENGELTNQGHSIGHWEDGTLIVETVQLEEHISAMIDGTPLGEKRRISERFRLSDDGRILIIDFTVEDPEFLATPFSGTMEWDYAPHLELIGIDCDPEISALPWGDLGGR